MNGDENPFTRWSRRKLGARAEETQATPGEKDAQGGPTIPVVADTHTQPEPLEDEAADPAEPLPRLEDLTAESDLTAFLRKGVPLALKSAALRKMWSLDPGIRDYVGPSEYAWDFNQPGSMAGFGPIDATKETVVDFLSKTVRALEPDAEPATAPQLPDALPRQQSTALPDEGTDETTPESVAMAQTSESNPPLALGTGETDPERLPHSSDDDKLQQVSEPVLRPRHGGAMPR